MTDYAREWAAKGQRSKYDPTDVIPVHPVIVAEVERLRAEVRRLKNWVEREVTRRVAVETAEQRAFTAWLLDQCAAWEMCGYEEDGQCRSHCDCNRGNVPTHLIIQKLHEMNTEESVTPEETAATRWEDLCPAAKGDPTAAFCGDCWGCQQ